MTELSRADRLREAFVVVSDADVDAWDDLIRRSGRLKTSRADILARVRLAFGEDDEAARDRLKKSVLKTAPMLPVEHSRLAAVVSGSQLIELFGTSSPQTEASILDAAALGVRILGRTSLTAVFPDLVSPSLPSSCETVLLGELLNFEGEIWSMRCPKQQAGTGSPAVRRSEP